MLSSDMMAVFGMEPVDVVSLSGLIGRDEQDYSGIDVAGMMDDVVKLGEIQAQVGEKLINKLGLRLLDASEADKTVAA